MRRGERGWEGSSRRGTQASSPTCGPSHPQPAGNSGCGTRGGKEEVGRVDVGNEEGELYRNATAPLTGGGGASIE